MYLKICAIGFLTFASYSLSRFPIIPLLAEGLGISPSRIGLIVGASTMTGIPGKIVFGTLSDIWGRRRILLFSMAVATLAPLGYLWLTGGFATLLALRFFHGLVTASFGPVSNAIVSDLAERHERGLRLGTYSSVTILGKTLGPWACGALIFWGGMKLPFLVSAALGASALALALTWPRSTPHAARRTPHEKGYFWQGVRELFQHRLILTTSVVEACQYLATGALEAFMPIYAKNVMGLNAWQIGFLFGVQMVGTFVTKPLMGGISDRVGRPAVIALGLLAGAGVIWLVPHQSTFGGLIVLVVIYGISVATVTAATAAYITDLCRRSHYGAAHGLFGTIMDMGHASGPVVGGMLIQALGYRPTFAIMSGVLLAAMGGFWAVSVQDRRRET